MTGRAEQYPVSRRMLGRLALKASLAASLAASASGRVIGAPASTPRFSVMAWALGRGMPFQRQIDIIGSAGYQGIELTGEFANWSASQLRDASARIRGHGLVVDAMAGVRTGFAHVAETDRFLGELSKVIESATVLGCKRIILVSGAASPDVATADQQLRVVQALQKAADLTAAAAMELIIEPIDPFENPASFLTGARQAKEILRQVSRPNMKILFDIFHEQRAHGNVLETFELLVKDIGLVHIADSPRRGAPGTGELNFTRFFSEASRLGYRDWIAMEFYPQGDPVAALQTARQEAIRSMALRLPQG